MEEDKLEKMFDYFYLKVTDLQSHSIELEVYQCAGFTENKNTGVYDVPFDLSLYLSAYIKWDGCSHVYMKGEDGDGDGYYHMCGKYWFNAHCKVIKFIYKYASENIKDFSKEVSE